MGGPVLAGVGHVGWVVMAARVQVVEVSVPDWTDAACRHEPPEWFHPVSTSPADADAAKAVCARCPIAADCLAYALSAREFGVWGGTTDGERSSMRRNARRRPA